MQKYSDVVLDSRGNALQGISVTVKTYPGAATATIYSDDGITTTTNPLTTDANGRFEFYAADGRYSLEISGTGFTTQTLTDVILFDDPAAASSGVFSSLTSGGAAGGVSIFYGDVGAWSVRLLNRAADDFCGIAFINYAGTTLQSEIISGTDSHIRLRTGTAQSEQVRVIHTASANRYITLTGSNGGNPTIGVSGGTLGVSTAVVASGSLYSANGTATPAGGTALTGVMMGSAGVGIFWGSGAPTLSAAQGSIYLRTDGGASTRIYSNNNGSTGWSAITSA